MDERHDAFGLHGFLSPAPSPDRPTPATPLPLPAVLTFTFSFSTGGHSIRLPLPTTVLLTQVFQPLHNSSHFGRDTISIGTVLLEYLVNAFALM